MRCYFILVKMVKIAGVKMKMRCSIHRSLMIFLMEDWRRAIFCEFGAAPMYL